MTRDSGLGELDLHLFNEGTHSRLYEKLGAHPVAGGTRFSVWAPNADAVSVIGEHDGWTGEGAELRPLGSSGVWSGIIDGVGVGSAYKYRIRSRDGAVLDKADPLAFRAELPPHTASIVHAGDYAWNDDAWMIERRGTNPLVRPMSIYELHLGSWRRGADGAMLGYREVAPLLIEHLQRLAFTHVELLPIMEHPFYGSWGYQTTSYFAPTARHGPPEDLAYLIDALHRAGLGVILDWVPSHFPTDAHALGRFDGTALYEHLDPREGFHPDWDTYIFNYGRNEVRSFLLSSAFFWLDRFHADGLRVDAVASMLYRDYSRAEGAWVPNRYGGRENLEAIQFLRELNTRVGAEQSGAVTIAEESTAWPMVSRPVNVGGLGFHFKWDMGWMHDTLDYLGREPVHRKYHHGEITFRSVYAASENFVLPLSHDEVVHGKGSLLGKMPGDDWQRMANLRLLYGYMFAQAGKKLLFMGAELGPDREWGHDEALDWSLVEQPERGGLQRWVGDLNRLYREEVAMHQGDCDPRGFWWIDGSDQEQSVLAFCRSSTDGSHLVVAVCNFTTVPRHNYRIGVPLPGFWREVLNSDAMIYGGSGQGNLGGLEATPVRKHGQWHSLNLTLPPLAVVFLRPEPRGATSPIDG